MEVGYRNRVCVARKKSRVEAICLCSRPLESATSFSKRSAIKSRSMSSASKPTSSSTSPLMFWRYCSASRSLRSAAVSSSLSESLPDDSLSSLSCLRRGSSSDPLLEIDSSRRARGGFVSWDFVFGLELVVLRLVEGAVLLSSRLRLRCEAGVVKNVDMIEDVRF